MAGTDPTGAERARSLRPWFLVAAMLLVWLVGVQGVSLGCQHTVALRDGVMQDERAALDEARLANDPSHLGFVMQAARIRAMAELRERTFPLAVGRLVLSLVVVGASAMALAGRPGARTFAMQALTVNAVFGVADYVLSEPVRVAAVDAVVRAADELFREPEHAPLRSAAFWHWLERFRLGALEVGAMVAGVAALGASRTRLFFEAVEAVEKAREREREDEP